MPNDAIPADGLLELEGVFRMRVAPGWTLTGIPGSRYKVSDDEREVDVSLRRTDGPPDDARATVLAFARLKGASGDVTVVTPQDEDGARAFAWFTAAAEDWVAAVLCHGRFTVLGSTHGPAGDHDAIADGERMLSTLGPSSPRRRWLRAR
ncbi:hypothetical protein [Cellulomonas alba]|uniref:Uncharacterized protein n=1 Tax=Cellulomonas alba TaxID=3053467 RepID=A0ABT7SHK1_9CELL|nr:hypothetical protein [Cellulomonas alba]MDM7855651.1 hypothetical protein [Cellulomonas alba]